MTTKAELVHQVVELLGRANQILDEIGEALPDDEPERWQPKGGEWCIHFNGSAQKFPTMNASRLIGSESQTREQAEAKAFARIARERLQTWVDEEGEGGHYTVMPAGEGKWRPVQMSWPMPWDVMMSESTARRAADLLTRGVIKLEIDQ